MSSLLEKYHFDEDLRLNNTAKTDREEKNLSFSTALSLRQTGDRSSSNTKHYVCAFVSSGPVIPRATNRKYPSERMNLRVMSRGCSGWICWCRLAYLSQKAASAVQKRGGWCHISLPRESVTNMSTAEHHAASLYLSALSYSDFFFLLRSVFGVVLHFLSAAFFLIFGVSVRFFVSMLLHLLSYIYVYMFLLSLVQPSWPPPLILSFLCILVLFCSICKASWDDFCCDLMLHT